MSRTQKWNINLRSNSGERQVTLKIRQRCRMLVGLQLTVPLAKNNPDIFGENRNCDIIYIEKCCRPWTHIAKHCSTQHNFKLFVWELLLEHSCPLFNLSSSTLQSKVFAGYRMNLGKEKVCYSSGKGAFHDADNGTPGGSWMSCRRTVIGKLTFF